MSTKRDRTHLKTYFETGDRPTEGEFIEFIDSMIIQEEDQIWVDATDPNKKVGIGTQFPKKKLDVNGDTHVNGTITVEGHIFGDKSNKTNDDDDVLLIGNGSGLQLFGKRHTSRPGDLFFIGDKADNGSGKIVFSQHLGPSAWRDNVIIDTNGNVGVGTMHPKDKLQVGEGIKKVAFGSAYGSATGWGGSYIGFNTVRDGNVWNTESDGANNGGALIYSDVSGALNFSTLATNNSNSGLTHSDQSVLNNVKLKIKSNGNVGIGTRDPQNRLEVNNGPSIKGESTGLRLPTNAGENRVLVSDNFGNTFWKLLTDGGLAGNALVPQGIIVMWSGVNLPNSGWRLCDGNNGVPVNGVIIPDLRGRFIVGYDPTDTDYNNTGKRGPEFTDARGNHNGLSTQQAKEVKLRANESGVGQHSHYSDLNGSTNTTGSHRHPIKANRETSGSGWGNMIERTEGNNDHNHIGTFDSEAAGNHSHTVNVKGNTHSFSADAVEAHENRPPYYVLAFIIKV